MQLTMQSCRIRIPRAYLPLTLPHPTLCTPAERYGYYMCIIFETLYPCRVFPNGHIPRSVDYIHQNLETVSKSTGSNRQRRSSFHCIIVIFISEHPLTLDSIFLSGRINEYTCRTGDNTRGYLCLPKIISIVVIFAFSPRRESLLLGIRL